MKTIIMALLLTSIIYSQEIDSSYVAELEAQVQFLYKQWSEATRIAYVYELTLNELVGTPRQNAEIMLGIKRRWMQNFMWLYERTARTEYD